MLSLVTRADFCLYFSPIFIIGLLGPQNIYVTNDDTGVFMKYDFILLNLFLYNSFPQILTRIVA